MKRKLLIFSVLAICVAILAAGTIAFFNAEGKAHNVITTGGVGIAVQEWADEARETPFENLDGILPGMKVTKLAEIKKTGKAEAWIRVPAGYEGHRAGGRWRARPEPAAAGPEHHRLDPGGGRLSTLLTNPSRPGRRPRRSSQRSISAAPWATPTRTPPRPSTLRPKASKRQRTARRHWRRPDGRIPTERREGTVMHNSKRLAGSSALRYAAGHWPVALPGDAFFLCPVSAALPRRSMRRRMPLRLP